MRLGIIISAGRRIKGRVNAVTIESAILSFNQAMAEGHAMVQTGQLGEPLRELMQHTREMLDIIDEEMAAGPALSNDAELRAMLELTRDKPEATERQLPPRSH